MDMKAMMFAGGGLFLSMVATTMWISGDVSRMRAEEQAKEAQRCAQVQADAQQAPAATPAAPTDEFSTPPAAESDADCGQADSAGVAGTTELDPVTGQPLAQDPGAFDPSTGLPADATTTGVDPTTGAPLDAGGQPITSTTDPGVGMPATDPSTGNVAVSGF